MPGMPGSTNPLLGYRKRSMVINRKVTNSSAVGREGSSLDSLRLEGTCCLRSRLLTNTFVHS
jgi:hypothetical protein